jgi:hypothetical protein
MTKIDLTGPAIWEKPKTPKEALEIALELARDEQRWASGGWVSFESVYRSERVAVIFDGAPLFCTDFRACAAGLLAIACGNGELLSKTFRGKADLGDYLRDDDVMGAEAARFLAEALMDVAEAEMGFTYSDWEREEISDGPEEAISRIIGINDACEDSEHHARIVRGFELAVVKAAEAEKATTA